MHCIIYNAFALQEGVPGRHMRNLGCSTRYFEKIIVNIFPVIYRYTVTLSYVLLSTVTSLNQKMSYYQRLRRYINTCPIINRYTFASTRVLLTITTLHQRVSYYQPLQVISACVPLSTVTPLRLISCFKIATPQSFTACVGKRFTDGWKVNILGFPGQEEVVVLNICT
jgi:hypothetical protein